MLKAIQILFIILNFIFSESSSDIQPQSPITLYDCTPASITTKINASIGPCFNTLGCNMPDCCGIISGQLTNFSFTYTATIPLTAGKNHGLLVGVGVGSTPDPLELLLPPRLIVQVPNLVVSYDYDACHYTVCPQVAGRKYRWDGLFTVPTTAITTLAVTAKFEALVTSNAQGHPTVFCNQIYARIVNKNFYESVTSIPENPPLGKILKKLLK